jgi:hypothetical protein
MPVAVHILGLLNFAGSAYHPVNWAAPGYLCLRTLQAQLAVRPGLMAGTCSIIAGMRPEAPRVVSNKGVASSGLQACAKGMAVANRQGTNDKGHRVAPIQKGGDGLSRTPKDVVHAIGGGVGLAPRGNSSLLGRAAVGRHSITGKGAEMGEFSRTQNAGPVWGEPQKCDLCRRKKQNGG